jgi:hypothetical protein
VPEPPGGGEEGLEGITKEGCPSQLVETRFHQPFRQLPGAHETAERREDLGIEMGRDRDPTPL